MRKIAICLFTVILSHQAAYAELSVANVFSQDMVLQQGKPIRI